MRFILGFLRGLKLPVKLLSKWLKRKKKRNELEEKCQKHVRNFAPGWLKNYSWQRSLGKTREREKRKENLLKRLIISVRTAIIRGSENAPPYFFRVVETTFYYTMQLLVLPQIAPDIIYLALLLVWQYFHIYDKIFEYQLCQFLSLSTHL
jgi:hypothetical protein